MKCHECLIWQGRKAGLDSQVIGMTDYLCKHKVSFDSLAWVAVTDTKKEVIDIINLADSDCAPRCVLLSEGIREDLDKCRMI